MCLRLLLEEYSPEIEYIKGPENMVANALRRLPNQGDIVDDVEDVLPFVPDDQDMLPVQMQKIKEKQEKDRSLNKKMRQNPRDYTKIIIKNQKIISYENCICILQDLCKKVLSSWYHHCLCHPVKPECTRPLELSCIGNQWKQTLRPLLWPVQHVRISRRKERSTVNCHPNR